MLSPAGCVWALSTDAVIWGELIDVRLIDYPAIRTTGITVNDWEFVDNCEGPITPAMELDILVESILHGSVPTNITVRVGVTQINRYNPAPMEGPEGQVEWVVVGQNPGSPLIIGQKMGLGIHYVSEYNVWSLMGEPMFGIDVSDSGSVSIRFQNFEVECYQPPPTEFDGLDLNGMSLAISACGQEWTEEAENRRGLVRRIWGPDGTLPHYYMTAYCSKLDVPQDGCVSDTECPQNETCVDGICQ
jgi:hypothetical protein